MENAKVRINVNTGDIEFEGSEQFVNEQMNNLETTIDIIAQLLENTTEQNEDEKFMKKRKEEEQEKLSSVEEHSLIPPETFGEWLHKFKSNISDSDKALITAYFVQKQSTDNDFKTKQVSDTLKDQGIKLSNPSTFLKLLARKKYMFQTRKVGSLIFQRVSADGVEYLKTLLR